MGFSDTAGSFLDFFMRKHHLCFSVEICQGTRKPTSGAEDSQVPMGYSLSSNTVRKNGVR